MSSGAASEEEVDQALETDAIGAEQHARLIGELERQAEERRRRTAGIARIAERIARGEKPDPNDPADRAAVEAHFETVANSLAELPPEDRAAAEDAYVAQTGILPTAIRNALLGGLLSSDPSVQVAAAQRLVKLEESDSAVSEGIPEALRARARVLAAFALPGVDPQRVVELAEKHVQRRGAAETVSAEKSDAGEASKDRAGKTLFDLYRENLRAREGGFVDHPQDVGGPTQKGISKGLLDELRKQRPDWDLPTDVQDLSEDQITKIFREEFFNRLKVEKVANVPGMLERAPQLPEQLFDAGVLHGPEVAGRLLQQSLDDILGTDLREPGKNGKLAYDGNVGPKTRDALARAIREGKIAAVNDEMVDKRLDFMRRQPKFKNFPGWVPRAESFRIGPRQP